MLFDNCFHLRSDQIPETVVTEIQAAEKNRLRADIKTLLQEQDAIIIAHYYTHPDIQILADETGGYVSDSLDMARFGNISKARTLVVCGVRFMGETAKILNPEKRILMPDLAAECSLDIGCPADAFAHFCDAHPNREVVVYANTSAEVKARADWMVTSGSAVAVIEHLQAQGKSIIWAPDRYLGEYVRAQTGADMLLWNGSCVVHAEFKSAALEALRARHPKALVLVHPESPPDVIAQADFVGSTTWIIEAVQRLPADSFIIGTDIGIFHKLQELAPEKKFLIAPTEGNGATCKSCASCPWMAMNDLQKLHAVLRSGAQEIHVPADIIDAANKSIQRLLNFTAEQPIALANDA